MAYPFTVRRAVPEDRAEISRIALAIDQDDWVPGALDELLADAPPGGLFIAEQEGRIVGFYHLILTERGDAHFSAMRIDPAAQGQGLGSLFCQAQVAQAQEAGAGRIYLISMVENRPAHRMVEKNGFANLGEWVVYEALPRTLGEPGHGPAAGRRARPASLADGPRLAALRRRVATSPVESVIAAPGSVWTLQSAAEEDWQPDGWWVVEEGRELDGAMLLGGAGPELVIRRLEGAPAAAEALLAAAVAEAGRIGCQQLGASLPARSGPLLQPLRPDPASVFRGYVFRHEAR